MDTPLCDCHGEPKRWVNDKHNAKGGYWRCMIKKKEAAQRHDQTEKKKESRRRYEQSEKRLKVRSRYEQSEKGLKTREAWNNSRYHGDNFERWIRKKINDRRYESRKALSEAS